MDGINGIPRIVEFVNDRVDLGHEKVLGFTAGCGISNRPRVYARTADPIAATNDLILLITA